MQLSNYTDGFFQINSKNGFLPLKEPLKKLPIKYADIQVIIDDLPRLKSDGTSGILENEGQIEERIANLKNFSEEVKKENDPFVIQALFRAYAFLTSSYTLAPAHFQQLKTNKYGKANQIIPPQLAIPFTIIASKLDVYPWLDYHYAYSLGNYVKKDKSKGMDWENLEMAVKFSGMPDERGFIMLHVDINQYSPNLIKGVFETLEIIGSNRYEDTKISKNIAISYNAMKNINSRRKLMWEASRWKNYNDFRVFIMGIKGNEEIFNEGVYFQGVDKEPHQYRGQTGAQDNIIPTMDIFSGVINFYPTNELTKYLMDLRSYRPVCVQRFFQDLRTEIQQIHKDGIVGALNKNKCYESMVYVLGILEEIYFFRNGHWQFVQMYIMRNTTYNKATGGTPIISWIPNQMMAVLDAMEYCAGLLDGKSDHQLFYKIKKGLNAKKQLLIDQLEILKKDTFDPKKVYNLNKKYSLKD